MFPALFPNKKKRYAHKKIQDCPDRTKEPVGWREKGFVESGVPCGNGGDGKWRAGEADEFTEDNGGNELGQMFHGLIVAVNWIYDLGIVWIPDKA